MAQTDRARRVISRARVLLETRDWCQGALARNRFMGQTEPRKTSAVYLDIMGALQLASHETTNDWVGAYNEAFIAVDNACRMKHSIELCGFNDTIATSKQDVLNLLSSV